jgi:hypothetical protein
MTGHPLEVLPLSRHRWVVRYEGDPTPITEHPTQAEAKAAARLHAMQFGERQIHVHELDGEVHIEGVEPQFRAPTPADVKGPTAEP